MKAEEVERYIHTYQQISNALVSEMRLTAFDQMICFLQGLPDNTATKIFEGMKFDVDEPATFSANGGIGRAVTIALTMTRKKANVSKMQELRILTEEQNQTPHTTEIRILRNPNATKETHIKTHRTRHNHSLKGRNRSRRRKRRNGVIRWRLSNANWKN